MVELQHNTKLINSLDLRKEKLPAATMLSTAFEKRILPPHNKEVFEEVDFLLAEVSDRLIGESGETLDFFRNEVASTAASPAPLTVVSSAPLSSSPNFAFSATRHPSSQASSNPTPLISTSHAILHPTVPPVLPQSALPAQSTTSCTVSLAPATASSNDSMCTVSLPNVTLHNNSNTNYEIPYVSVNEISPLPKDFLAEKNEKQLNPLF